MRSDASSRIQPVGRQLWLLLLPLPYPTEFLSLSISLSFSVFFSLPSLLPHFSFFVHPFLYFPPGQNNKNKKKKKANNTIDGENPGHFHQTQHFYYFFFFFFFCFQAVHTTSSHSISAPGDKRRHSRSTRTSSSTERLPIVPLLCSRSVSLRVFSFAWNSGGELNALMDGKARRPGWLRPSSVVGQGVTPRWPAQWFVPTAVWLLCCSLVRLDLSIWLRLPPRLLSARPIPSSEQSETLHRRRSRGTFFSWKEKQKIKKKGDSGWKQFPIRFLMASWWLSAISTATTRQSTTVMAPLANERLLVPLLLLLAAGTAICSVAAASVESVTASVPPAGPSVKILAVFDETDMETMERVMQKTLIALNKEKTAWAGTSWMGEGIHNNNSSLTSNVRGPWYSGKRRKEWLAGRLTVESVAFSSQWWANQTADDLGHLFIHHRPAAVLALSADEHSVFRVALAAASYHLPVIGARAHRGLDDSSFRVSQRFFFFLVSLWSVVSPVS